MDVLRRLIRSNEMVNVQHDLLRHSIKSMAHLLLRCFDPVKRTWGESERDDEIFNDYVVIWACYEAGIADRSEISGAVQSIENKRNQKGYWCYDQGRKSVQATSRALIALILGGQKDKEKLVPGLEHIMSKQLTDGGWDEAGDVRSEVSGLGGTLPVSLALTTFRRKIGPHKLLDRSIETSLDECNQFLNKELAKYLDNPDASPEGLLKYSWIIRGLCTAGPDFLRQPRDKLDELAKPMLSEIDNNESDIWKESSYQQLYNVVHSLSLLGYTSDNKPTLTPAQRWLQLRFADATPTTVRGRGREVRYLSGAVLASSKLYGNGGPNVGPLIPIDNVDCYAVPMSSEIEADLPEGSGGVIVAISSLLEEGRPSQLSACWRVEISDKVEQSRLSATRTPKKRDSIASVDHKRSRP
jgi:hypothetical protein